MREEVIGKISSRLAFNMSYRTPEDYTLLNDAVPVHVFLKEKLSRFRRPMAKQGLLWEGGFISIRD